MIDENQIEYSGDIIFVVEKQYEDGWHWYCGYPTLEEARMRANVVNKRDRRNVRIRKFQCIQNPPLYTEEELKKKDEVKNG